MLVDGERIRCSVLEDPQVTEDGLRLFLSEPVRDLAPGEKIAHLHLDRLPARSQATLVWPNPSGRRLQGGSISWRDSSGRTHRKSVQADSGGESGDLGTVDLG